MVGVGKDSNGPRDTGYRGATFWRSAMRFKSLLGVAVCTAALTGAGASAALAGEVKGPPNQRNNTNETGALDHAHSACAASGLNDFDLAEGQIESQVQTAADSWKFYGLPKGAVGTACRGNAEPEG